MTQLLSFMSEIAKQGEEPASRPSGELDLLLYAPCPVKLVMKDAVDNAGKAIEAAGGKPLAAHVPMGCTSVDPYDPLCRATDPADLPAVIASIGFGDFWKRPFMERFGDLFEAVRPPETSELFERAGIPDPDGRRTIYGLTPYLFVVDEARLGGLPVPRSWEELLEPRYKGRISMCGDGDDMADAVVLSVYAKFGRSGLRALAGNCRGFMHSSSMTKAAGAKDERLGAIFVMPAFFACSTKQPASVRTVWPREGAAASPLYFLARKTEKARLTPLLTALTEGFAAIPSAAWFAPLALPAARSPLPPEAAFHWIGWDFIKNNDINALRDSLNHEFREMNRQAMAEAPCAS